MQRRGQNFISIKQIVPVSPFTETGGAVIENEVFHYSSMRHCLSGRLFAPNRLEDG